MLRKLISLILALSLMISLSATAFADRVDPDGYLVLGADLSAEQTQDIYDLLGITDDSGYEILYTSNKEEHKVLDDYLDPSVIGTKALSSILLVPGKAGSGIHVEAYNISYCTVSMYQNALIDAGVEDCALYIASPVYASGTCALVSAMKAYSFMTGEAINSGKADAALDELITTGKLGDLMGDNDQAAELIAALKQKMLEKDMSEEDIAATLDELCEKMDIDLNDSLKAQIIQLMLKIKNTNIDVDALREQAGELYGKVKDTVSALDIDTAAAGSFLQTLIEKALTLFNTFLK